LLAYDITDLQNAATDSIGTNSSDNNMDGSQNVGQSKNHIQFNGLTGFSGGTALLPISQLSLPVKLSEFKTKSEDCDINLTWTTESETNFDYFELQWSGNGIDFNRIDIIKAEGGDFAQSYQYVDKADSKFNYYRLKMVDLDKSVEYSNIVLQKANCEDSHEISIYPNPINQHGDLLNVSFYSNRKNALIQMTDMLGRVVKKITLDVEAEFENTVQIDISDLPSGNYNLQLIGNRYSKMVIIQE